MTYKSMIRDGLVAGMISFGLFSAAQAQSTDGADPALVDRGHYLATAGDCAACHSDSGAGGLAIESPMGAIYASNITPDTEHGIGSWTLQQFGDALRKGRAPGKGWLFPAMPYTSYTGLTDADVKALYSYFKLGVKPDAHQVPETKLPFPFFRPAMIGWNMLKVSEGKAAGAIPVQGDELKRGQYLVETLGHCSTCHTPRDDLMGEIDSKHLGGGLVGTWNAPNITPAASGIGSWSDADLVKFLRTGNAPNGSVAAGEMGLAVEHSFSHLPDGDLKAMVAYLRKVPAVDTPAEHAPVGAAKPLEVAKFEAPLSDWKSKVDYTQVTAGERLYIGACAACHGVNGQGTPDGVRPSLVLNGTVRSQSPDNLIHVINDGVDRQAGNYHAFMPAFATQMSQAQIADLASFVRIAYANLPEAKVSLETVRQVLSGEVPVSWVIRYAATMAYVGIAIGFIVILLLILFFRLRDRRPRMA